jgi:hypothetical protein
MERQIWLGEVSTAEPSAKRRTIFTVASALQSIINLAPVASS